ncbi:hypothetical protein LCGC14_1211630 [marine sediment metagenome]|uniref:Uncharacterized protein n=1 Tax=marine sediment metagenome TaxID=412755 RepID=A0A0F9PIF5_9ZZZZ
MEKDLIGKQVKIIWDDKDRPSQKEGIVQATSNNFITIKTERKIELIPVRRILRIELQGGNGK